MVNVLIVYAHPEETSLNAAVQRVTVETLREAGHTVVVSDLYKQNFRPVLGRHDIRDGVLDKDNFRYSIETKAAADEGRLAPDIVEEQAKVKDADIIIFQFPMYWLGLPAILKGWVERVFTQGFAFDLGQMFDQGYFKGKRAMLSFTTGGTRGWYTNRGPMGDIEVTLWPLHNSMFRFVGFDVLSPHIMFGTDAATKEQLSVCLKKWESRLRTLDQEPPLEFIPLSDYEAIDPSQPMAALSIKPEAADRKSALIGPTVGQHCGRPLPVGSMYRPAAELDKVDLVHDITGSSAS